jgi:vacuolar-type H+-ATPase catalytic subunit A/Vma1
VARQYADGTVILTNKVAHRGYYPAVGFGAGLSTSKTTGMERREELRRFFEERKLRDWIELGDHIAATVADSEGPLTDQIKVLTAKRMSAEDYRRYLLGNVYRRAFFVQDSGHVIDQKTSPERMLVMMRFCRELDDAFPLLQDKERARGLADQLGGKAYEVTLLQEGYQQAYQAILEWLQTLTSEDRTGEPGPGHAAI